MVEDVIYFFGRSRFRLFFVRWVVGMVLGVFYVRSIGSCCTL